jgi:RNA polymerase sigma factor for flagellar operon FliA
VAGQYTIGVAGGGVMALRLAVARDAKSRNELVMAHVGLVRSLAQRLSRRLPAQVERSELVSVGVLGLIDAATRYQPSLGVPFDAFARRRIHGAMLDALRQLDWVPRSVRRLQRSVEDVMTTLRHTLRREPEAEEIARALGVSATEYAGMLDDLRSADLASIRQTKDDGGHLLEVAIEPDAGPYVQLERRELRERLARALGELPDRERQILALYYEEELTLAEIGEVLGVTESRVCQLRSQAIARLRSIMTAWLTRLDTRDA